MRTSESDQIQIITIRRQLYNSRKFERTNFLCSCKAVREEKVHLKSADCPVYADIRERFVDLDDDNTLMKYFTMVLERRNELDR